MGICAVIVISRAVLLVLTLWCFQSASLAGDAADELASLLRDYVSQWSEGHVKAKTKGAFGPSEVEVWWAGDRVRREFKYYGLDGNRDPELQGQVMSPSQRCRFSPESLGATCNSLKDYGSLAIYLRVLPTESWLELMYKKPLVSWLRDTPGARTVIKTSKGEFVALFASAERDADLCAEAVLEKGIAGLDAVQLSESGVVAHFDARGLPMKIWFIGVPEQNQFKLSYAWTDEARPVLQQLSRELSTDGGKTFELDFELEVLNASRRLGDDAPSLAIPPKDLPFGTMIRDKRGSRTKVTYVGGEAGKVHNSLQRTVRSLKKTDRSK